MIKILVVLTNITHYANTNIPTGLWLGEATEFIQEVSTAGFEVDYISPNGGFVPIDPRSMSYVKDEDMAIYNNKDFQKRALTLSLKPSEVNPKDYAAIYYTGGHGVMWDFPHNPELQKISLSIYNNGGYLVSVCHGIAGLLYISDNKGEYIIKGKKITGFTTAEEFYSGKKSKVPFFNKDVATKNGAIFKNIRPFGKFAISDGKIITGQNPFSTKKVAQLLVIKINNTY